MGTTAKILIEVMQARLSMCESRGIVSSEQAIKGTRLLVNELRLLSPGEAIDVTYTTSPFCVQYIRRRTGQILSEIQES